MFKLFRFLKPYWLWIIAILLLVTAQVYSQLSLPDLMSKIVNNGIYYDYVKVTPYEVQKDSEGKAEYYSTAEVIDIFAASIAQTQSIPFEQAKAYILSVLGEDFELPYRVPKAVLGTDHMPIYDVDENDSDYKYFINEETGRLYPAYGPSGITYLNKDGNTATTPDERVTKADIGYIMRSGGLMLLFTLGVSIAAVLASMFSAKVSMEFGGILRSKVFSKVEQLLSTV